MSEENEKQAEAQCEPEQTMAQFLKSRSSGSMPDVRSYVGIIASLSREEKLRKALVKARAVLVSRPEGDQKCLKKCDAVLAVIDKALEAK
jgi:hypothetical protein